MILFAYAIAGGISAAVVALIFSRLSNDCAAACEEPSERVERLDRAVATDRLLAAYEEREAAVDLCKDDESDVARYRLVKAQARLSNEWKRARAAGVDPADVVRTYEREKYNG